MKTYVVEHKTSSEDIGLGSIYWKKLTLDAQISNYLVGARSMGLEPDGVLYDVLRKLDLEPRMATPLALRKYTKATKTEPSRLYASQRETDETPYEYLARCLDDIRERPDHYYQRGVVVRLAHEEREAAADLWNTADQIRLAQNANMWPRNVDSCSQYRRMCDYWPVCSGETTIDSPIFESGETHRELSGRHHLPLVTTSSARTFRSCARRYYYAYAMGRRPASIADARSFGQRIHAGLEAWLTSGQDLTVALEAVRGDTLDFESARAVAMLTGYHARWAGDPLETLAVEKEFICDLTNPATGAKSRTFALAGKIDAIVGKAA